jgi:hypothetical protein
MAAASAVTLGLAIAATGYGAFIAWFDAVGRITWYDVRFNSSVFGFLARVWGPHPTAWGAILGGLTAGTAFVLLRRPASLSRDWLFVFLAALLAAPLGWRYYLCLIIGPLVATMAALPRSGALLAILCLLLISPAPAFVSNSPVLLATVGSIPMWTALSAWGALAHPAARNLNPEDTR